MALEGMDLYWLLVVVMIILGVILFNQFMAQRAKERREAEEEPVAGELLSRFAHHEGSVVGETVAVEGDRLILKQAGVFKSVPAAMATREGDEVVLQGYIDWDAAKEAGERWLEQNRKGIDEQVSANLTRSEDVQAPALQAFQARRSDDSEE